MDNEYFNRKGFDVHGGYYIHELEYIPGPSWLSDLCCYEDERELYEQIDLEKGDDEAFFGGDEEPEEALDDELFKGDFECEGEDDGGFNDAEFAKYMKDLQSGKSADLLKGFGSGSGSGLDSKALEEIMKGMQGMGLGVCAPQEALDAKANNNNKKKKGSSSNKNKKKKAVEVKKAEDEDWETASDN